MDVDCKVYRIVDANFNRAKEGLRVCEDICRFFLDKQQLTAQYKRVRHQLSNIAGSLKIKTFIESRNIEEDVGKVSTAEEFCRGNVVDIFYANSQRGKESIRVLEEFFKLINSEQAQELKTLRYQIYAIEKKVTKEF